MASDAQQSLLLDLPRELVDKILQDYVKSRRDLLHMRLVCRALNDVAKHIAVKNVYLERDLINSIQNLLNLGSSAYTKYTTSLLIGPDECAHGIPEEEDLVIKLIGKLNGLTSLRIWFNFYKLPTTPHLIQAVGNIPRLRSLSLEEMRPFHLSGPLIAPALANAHRLESLVFEVRHLKMPEDADAAQKQARALVVACPNLESLEIGRQCAIGPGGCRQCKFEFDISDILSGLTSSTLRTLILRNGVKISPSSPSTLDCLSNLTSLFIPNSHKGHQLLWPILRELEVKLLSLTVESGSEPLLQYLLSFEGLREFQVGEKKTGSDIDQGMEQEILFEGLPHHRVTLQQISLLPPHLCSINPPINGIEAWAIDCNNIPGWLEQFARMKTLGLAVYADKKRLLTCMEPVIRSLTSGQAPCLTNVIINIGEANPQSFPVGNPTLIAETSILCSFLDFPLVAHSQGNWSQLSITIFLCSLYVENKIPFEFWMEKQPYAGTYKFKTTDQKMRDYRYNLRTEAWRNRYTIVESKCRAGSSVVRYNVDRTRRRWR